MPKEITTELEYLRWCEAEGGECLKLKIDGERGFPDRTLLLPGALALFIETKTKKGKPSPQQVKWIARLQQLGFTAEVVRTLDEAKAAVAKARARK